MKSFFYFILICFISNTQLFCQVETKPFLLNKDDYSLLEDKNQLVNEAIVNAFGEPSSQNNYKLEILQVDAGNSRIKEFKYFPDGGGENKSLLKSKALKYPDNYNIDFKVKINKEKSVITEAIKPFLDKKFTFILSIAVIGNAKIFITEARNKEKFNEMLAEKSFASKAFKRRFGDELKNKYQIVFENLNACLVKDLYNPACTEEYELLQSKENYETFSKKVTTEEYDGTYILFKVPVIRKKSKLTPSIEETLIKEPDGSEVLKFYFCIPRSVNKPSKPASPVVIAASKPLSTGNIKGKMLAVNSKMNPLKNETVELRSSANKVVQSAKTDESGTFEFKDVDLESSYTIELPNYTVNDKNTKIYVANMSSELIKELTVNEQNKFSFKTIDADVYRLSTMNENDVELTFLKQKKSNKDVIIIQDFVYYDLNSYKILSESISTLDKIIKILNENSNFNLEVVSHTDARGEEDDNLKLSQKRSESVLTYLITNGKIDSKRVKPVGLGESKPLNSCLNTASCIENEYKMNRRTEFVFKRS